MLQEFSLSEGIKNILHSKKENPVLAHKIYQTPPPNIQNTDNGPNICELYSEINSILTSNDYHTSDSDLSKNYHRNPNKNPTTDSPNKLLEENQTFFKKIEQFNNLNEEYLTDSNLQNLINNSYSNENFPSDPPNPPPDEDTPNPNYTSLNTKASSSISNKLAEARLEKKSG
jgi:hypothetical protein